MGGAIALEAVVERLPVEAVNAGVAVGAEQLAVEVDADLGVGAGKTRLKSEVSAIRTAFSSI